LNKETDFRVQTLANKTLY